MSKIVYKGARIVLILACLTACGFSIYWFTSSRESGHFASVTGEFVADQSGQSKAIKVTLRNLSTKALHVNLNPEYFGGYLLLVSEDGMVQPVRLAKLTRAMQTGIIPMVDLKIEQEGEFSWEAPLSAFAKIDGTSASIESESVARVLCVPESIWVEVEGELSLPWINPTKINK